MVKKHIELDQVQDPAISGRTISDLHMEGDKITVEFLDEEGSEEEPLEDLTRDQLEALIKSLAQTFPEE